MNRKTSTRKSKWNEKKKHEMCEKGTKKSLFYMVNSISFKPEPIELHTFFLLVCVCLRYYSHRLYSSLTRHFSIFTQWNAINTTYDKKKTPIYVEIKCRTHSVWQNKTIDRTERDCVSNRTINNNKNDYNKYNNNDNQNKRALIACSDQLIYFCVRKS